MYIKMFIVHVNMKTTEKDLKTESWVINLAVELIFVQLFYFILTAEGGMLQNSTATPPPWIATLSWWRVCVHTWSQELFCWVLFAPGMVSQNKLVLFEGPN